MSSCSCRHVARHGTSHVSVEWYWYSAITHTISTVITGTEIHPLMRARRMASELPWPTTTRRRKWGRNAQPPNTRAKPMPTASEYERQRRGRGEVTVDRRQGRRRAPAGSSRVCLHRVGVARPAATDRDLGPPGAERRERGRVDGQPPAAPPGAVNTPTRVSVGSEMRSVRRQASAAGELVTTTTSPRPSPGSRSSSPSDGPSWIGARRVQRVRRHLVRGGRRHAVTKRVVRPTRSALGTRLAAATIARSKTSASSSDRAPVGVTVAVEHDDAAAHALARSCCLTLSSSDRADARQWIERGSSPVDVVAAGCGTRRDRCAATGEQVTAEHAAARAPASAARTSAGRRVISVAPAASRLSAASPSRSRRRSTVGPMSQHAAPRGGNAVAGGHRGRRTGAAPTAIWAVLLGPTGSARSTGR